MLASARDSLGRTGELGPRAIVGAFLTRKTNLAVLALQALLAQGRRIVAYPDRAPSSALEFAPEDFKAISNELRLLGPARLGRAVIMLLLQLELSFFITRCRGPTPSLLMLTVQGKDRPDFDQFAVPVWKMMRVESQQHHRAEANQVILLR